MLLVGRPQSFLELNQQPGKPPVIICPLVLSSGFSMPSLAKSDSRDPSLPGCTSPLGTADCYASCLRSRLSQATPCTLRRTEQQFMNKLRGVGCGDASSLHNSFCSPFSLAGFSAAICRLSSSTASGPDWIGSSLLNSWIACPDCMPSTPNRCQSPLFQVPQSGASHLPFPSELQVPKLSSEELLLSRPVRCGLSRLRCHGHSLLVSSYLHRISRKENSACSACGHPLQDLNHLLLDCPASEPSRKSIFNSSLSILELWSRPWGVARLLGLSEGVR